MTLTPQFSLYHQSSRSWKQTILIAYMSATEPTKSHSLAPVEEVDSNEMFSLSHPLHGCIRDHLDRQRQITGQRPLAIQNNVDDDTTSNYSPLPGQTCGEHPMQGWASASGPLFQAPAIFKSVIAYKNPATFAAPQAPSSLAARHRRCVLNAQDRCRWQHDKVLCRLAELLEMCRR